MVDHGSPAGEAVPFLIRRSSAPQWLGEPSAHSEPRIYDALGEQAEWGFAIPWVHRILASPLTREPFLEAPQRGIQEVDGPVGYWSALLHLLVYGLGWVRPDRGMRWWYDSGKPVTDHTLRLISQIWDADGQLDWFTAWLWSQGFDTWAEWSTLLREVTGYVLGPTELYGDPILTPDDPWLRAREREAEASGVSAPVGGGWDPHHLSRHIQGPLQPVAGRPLLVSTSAADRRAVILLDSMMGWYRALSTETLSLPTLVGHSWRIEVVVKPVGWLGTYRKSAQTGLWFSGRHSVHIHGT